MPTTTALPEKLRLARNIQEGYEVLTATATGDELWAPVVHALEMYAPIALVSLTVDINGEQVRMPAMRPTDRVMSRRSAS